MRDKLWAITGRIAPDKLSFEQLAKITGALAILEQAGIEGLIEFERKDLRRYAVTRQRRRDVGAIRTADGKARLQPQAEAVFELLDVLAPQETTAREAAQRLGISENSVRAQLNHLQAKGLAQSRRVLPRQGTRAVNLWSRA